MVSIIVPIYNAEAYLARCLDSIISQTLQDIEIVCVNDGSSDGSLEIVKKYADRDSRILIVDKKNGGLVSARKAGLDAACGEYIGFVDSDDYVDPEMYETLYKYATEKTCDVVCSGYLFEGDYVSRHVDCVTPGLYEGDRLTDIREQTIMRLDDHGVGIRASLCCKLFSKALLDKVYLSVSDKLTISEDKITTLYTMLEAKCVVVIDEAFYHYVKNTGSMVHSFDENYLTHVQTVWDHLRKAYTHPNFTDRMRVQAEVYLMDMLYKGINGRMGFACDNMLWVDPYWLDRIPDGSGVLLYGYGVFLNSYKRQAENSDRFEVTGTASSTDEVQGKSFDVIVIAIKNKEKAGKEKDALIKCGIGEEKILWFPQDEIYWRFVDANGWS